MAEAITWEEACRNDDKYQEFIETVNTRYKTAYLKGIRNKLSEGYKDRVIRQIKTKQIMEGARERLVEILLENQQLRSNITEEKSDVYSKHAALEAYQEKLIAYLKNKYATLFNVLKNETMRRAAVENITSNAVTKLRSMESFMYFCDERIKDIDQEKWAVKSIIDALQINEAVGGHI